MNRALVADDSVMNHVLIAKSLKKHVPDAIIEQLYAPDLFIDRLLTDKYQLAITDQHFQIGDFQIRTGLQAIQRLRQEGYNGLIYLISSEHAVDILGLLPYLDTDNMTRYMHRCDADYVKKLNEIGQAHLN